METFISAIKKMAIKEVGIYSDEKISATKKVITMYENDKLLALTKELTEVAEKEWIG